MAAADGDPMMSDEDAMFGWGVIPISHNGFDSASPTLLTGRGLRNDTDESFTVW